MSAAFHVDTHIKRKKLMQADKTSVAIIDYGMGNLFSVKRACEEVNLHATITSDPEAILKKDAAILPGVGAFGDAMKNIRNLNLIDSIKDFIRSGKAFMGICLGMQLLMAESEEFGIHEGLGVIEGSVIRFSKKLNKEKIMKVPQVGWNTIHKPKGKSGDIWQNSPLKGIPEDTFMYFVHSYYVSLKNREDALSNTVYEGIDYCSSLKVNNIFACQFHPEKSAKNGLKIYRNWAREIKRG